jgi:hypothetical protein
MSPLLLLALLVAAPAPSRAPVPGVEQVQQAALHHASLPATMARRWLGRARTAAWLPRVGVQLDLDADRGYRLDRAADSPDELSTDAGRSRGWRLDLTWDLDRVIFNPDELRAARSALDVLDHRAALLAHVTELYFERQAAVADLRAAGASAAPELRRAVAELDAQLLALTGLRFPPVPVNPAPEPL